MIKKTFNFKLIFLLSILMISKYAFAQAEKAVLDGSFLTGDLCGFWSDERWQQEFTALKNVGMHYVVIQAVANSYPGRVTKTLYPSSLPNTEMAKGGNGIEYPDVVDACLRNAELAGMKVFLGIDFSDKWWDLYANDSTWLYNQMDLDNNICDELWNNYKNKYPVAFHGWYWSYEVENLHFTTDEQQRVLTNAMNKQLDHLTSTNKKLPFMWCPFMNSEFGEPEAYETMWKNVFAGLHTTAGDIFCPQDGVGAGGLKLNEIASWFSALRRAVDTKPGLVMWADVETFEFYGSSFISTVIGRVVSQQKIEQPYVNNYISWEYTYYDSPYKANTGFHNTYLNYLENDSLENLPPTSPSDFSAVSLPGSIVLNWDVSTDNIGVCGYNVYRNGEMIIKKQVPSKNNDTTDIAAATSAVDANVNPNTSYSYQIEAYDFAGNVSNLTLPVLVTTKNYDEISLGAQYTVSTTPSDYYPDTGNKKLTDGKMASQAYYADPQWVGFNNIDTLDVVIDLGQNVYVQNFITNYLLDPQPAVYLPEQVSISVSTDNFTFINIGIMIDSTPNETSSSIHKYYYELSNPVNTRYVKFSTITSGSAWLFVDEYQVLSSITSDVQENSTVSLNKFKLKQNYPNPFNPSTTIKYAIPYFVERNSVSLQNNERFGESLYKVTLKVYDILGREVTTLVKKEQAPGSYQVQLDASKLPSGVYFYRITASNPASRAGSGFTKTMKMILLK